MNQERARRSGGSPVFGVFVLATGIVLLLNVLDVAPWEVWLELWRWWPLALILGGAGMLLRRVHPAVMTLVTAVAVTGAVAFSWATAEGNIAPYDTSTTTFAERIESATSAAVNIQFGGGRLSISPLPSESDFLLDAILEDRENGPRMSVTREGDTATVNLNHRSGWNWVGFSSRGREWDLYLNPNIEYTVDIDGGASSYDLDFEGLDVSQVMLDIGASSIEMTVPDRVGHTDVRINGGAARIDVVVPAGIAARIQIDSGLSSIDIDEGRFPKVDRDHVSPDYETAANRVNIVIAAGVSSISVR